MTTRPSIDPTDTLAILKAAREWLDDPAHWATHTAWRDDEGLACYDLFQVASTCAVGAIALVCGGGTPPRPHSLLAAQCGWASVIQVNDGPDGYRRILAAYDKAIAAVAVEDGAA